MPACAGRTLERCAAAVAVLTVVLGLAASGVPRAGATTARGMRALPSAWTARVCGEIVDVQAAALEAREALLAATTAAPADRTAVRAGANSLADVLRPVRAALRRLDRSLTRAAPEGMGGTAVRDGLRDGFGPVREAYARATDDARGLRRAPPGRYPTLAGQVLRRLDRALDGGTRRFTRLEPTVNASRVGREVAQQAICRRVGFEWSVLPSEPGVARTPAPPAVAPTTVGAADLTAPRLLLPGRYRPPEAVVALAHQAAMTGRGRVFFYGGVPAIDAGATFVTECPASDADNVQILGCYHGGRITVLAVTRPEVATVMAVTAAHEMLHAVYAALDDETRRAVDAQTAAFRATTTDLRLLEIVGRYEARDPAVLPDELHSLLATQVATVPAELEAHFGAYFRDRAAVLVAYEAYVAVFEERLGRYHDLEQRILALREQITALRAQSDAAGREANRLAADIEALRAQGRVAESNALVPAQNAAVTRAQSANAEANRLVDAHNALVAEADALAEELTGLESALRPIG